MAITMIAQGVYEDSATGNRGTSYEEVQQRNARGERNNSLTHSQMPQPAVNEASAVNAGLSQVGQPAIGGAREGIVTGRPTTREYRPEGYFTHTPSEALSAFGEGFGPTGLGAVIGTIAGNPLLGASIGGAAGRGLSAALGGTTSSVGQSTPAGTYTGTPVGAVGTGGGQGATAGAAPAADQGPNAANIQQAIERVQGVGADAQARAAADSVLALDQAQNYANRAAPPAVQTSNPGQQQALERAQGVQSSTGAAGALTGFQAPQQGVQSLRDFASGPRGPSAAAAQLRIQAARDARNQLALARSAQGGPAEVARAMRQAQGELGRVAAETRGQAALLRATEEDQFRAQQLNALTGAGQLEQQGAATQVQALGEGGRQAQAATQQEIDAALAEGQLSGSIRTGDLKEGEINLSAELQTMGLNDQQVRFFSGLAEQMAQHAEEVRLRAEAQGLDANVAIEQLKAEYRRLAWQQLSDQQRLELERRALAQNVDFADRAATERWIDRALGFAGTLATAIGSSGIGSSSSSTAGASTGVSNPTSTTNNLPVDYGSNRPSDRLVKKSVSPMKGIAADLRKSMGHSWKYKNPEKHGNGRHTGAMAQDLERTKNFRGVVSTGPDGVKMVDGARLAMAHHGALADMQKQIDRLKKASRKVARRN